MINTFAYTHTNQKPNIRVCFDFFFFCEVKVKMSKHAGKKWMRWQIQSHGRK